MIVCHARSDVGLKRSNNEDRVHVDGRSGLAIVADGMGGHAAGEIASQLAVEAIVAHLSGRNGFVWPFRRRQRERAALIDAVRHANRSVYAASEADSAHRGMGTTVVALWIRSRVGHVAHVGDSRLYRIRDGSLERLTRDHSMAGIEGMTRNVLTRAVGVEPDVEIDYREIELRRGDSFLLCSDGLSGVVEDATIERVLLEGPGGEATVEKLIALAHSAGAPDNVTVALVHA